MIIYTGLFGFNINHGNKQLNEHLAGTASEPKASQIFSKILAQEPWLFGHFGTSGHNYQPPPTRSEVTDCFSIMIIMNGWFSEVASELPSLRCWSAMSWTRLEVEEFWVLDLMFGPDPPSVVL